MKQFRRAALAVRYRSKASIFVRKALHIRPRDQIGGKPPSSRVSRSMSGGRQSAFFSCEHEPGTLACRLRKVAGQDMRFSMKMMFAPVPELRGQPSERGQQRSERGQQPSERGSSHRATNVRLALKMTAQFATIIHTSRGEGRT